MNRFLAAVAALLLGVLPAQLACAASDNGISESRHNAIVRAAEQVGPAVVSIIVTQVQIVTYDPFGGLGFDEFFRDFFPRRQYRQEVKSMGSGVIISPDGDIITNAHVVHGATQVKVTLPDGREFDAALTAVESDLDLALLRIESHDLPVAPIGTSEDLMIGEWAIAFGNPFGYLLEDAQPTVTVGVISALHRDVHSARSGDFTDMIQTDAAINPGNSGGPLCNADGEVIGMNTFIFTHSGGSEGIGFARPIDDVREFIDEVQGRADRGEFSEVETPLGATVANINSALRLRYGLPYHRGVVVVDVEQGSVAEKINLHPGDVILMAQGKAIRSARGLVRLYRKLPETIGIVIDRNGDSSFLFWQRQ